jgi:hypothetical protein
MFVEAGIMVHRMTHRLSAVWFKANCDPYKDEVLPEAPRDLVEELSWRYICIYEMITGEKFEFPPLEPKPHDRIVENSKKAK